MSIKPLSLYNYEAQIIYQSDNIERGYQYMISHPEYQVYVTRDEGQHQFNKIGVCLKYLNSEISDVSEDAVSRLHKAISKLLKERKIGFVPNQVSSSTEQPPCSSTKKYYAVRIGRQPGVYTSWKETEEQTLGFPGNKHKSFPTLEEALEYLR